MTEIQLGKIAAISHSLHLTVRWPAHPTKFIKAEGVLGGCYITVEIAGPRPYREVVLHPEHLRSMAGWVTARCVLLNIGIGGFITMGFRDLVRYTVNPQAAHDTSSLATEIDFARYPESTSFLTVTVHSPGKGTKPGDTDPIIPVEIARINIIEHEFYPGQVAKERLFNYNTQKFTQYAVGTVRGGDRPWWQPTRRSASDNMIYECDAGLGSPAEVDCSQIEWHQVKPASDSLTVGPGNPTFLHSNTCYLAITATTNMVLTWAQITTALSTLVNVCVRNPVKWTAKGGRAYYGHQAPFRLSGRPRKREDALTGLNALPPKANITLFQQKEAWMDTERELKSCTWVAVSKGSPVSTCHG
ncbi:MAG: hypothetical protein Q9187_003625 [Circinaria calcarea]